MEAAVDTRLRPALASTCGTDVCIDVYRHVTLTIAASFHI
ncbi:hypothetical protein COLO4_05758 [Corchorus olitorius]|uniref:Uncharacterized protein n=1 Tax=Corchorus olitorius TaxID=93759 RepID=A0A1R3KPY1_9ROSI|nr:hypothetical protein COLO4_05758 [Corchorus olitorius]